MYDITNENSFKNIRNWIKQAEVNASINACKVLVGNWCDKLDRKISREEGKKLADDFHMKFFEASPKTNQNVNEVFDYLVRGILKFNEVNKFHNNIKAEDINLIKSDNKNEVKKHSINSEKKMKVKNT